MKWSSTAGLVRGLVLVLMNAWLHGLLSSLTPAHGAAILRKRAAVSHVLYMGAPRFPLTTAL